MRTCATHTIPSLPGCIDTILPSCHSNGGAKSPFITTSASTAGGLWDVFHLLRCCKVWRYPWCHRHKKSWWTRWMRCHLRSSGIATIGSVVNKCPGVSTNKSSRLSAEIGHNGREFNTASHNPPLWGADGGVTVPFYGATTACRLHIFMEEIIGTDEIRAAITT